MHLNRILFTFTTWSCQLSILLCPLLFQIADVNIGKYVICRVGSASLILGMMWWILCRHCCLELIGQSLFHTQLMGSWPLERRGFLVEALKNNFWPKPETGFVLMGTTKFALLFFACLLLGRLSPLFIFVNFQQLLLCAWASQFTRKSLIKQSILYPLYCTSWNGSLRLIMSKSWDLFNYTFRGKTRVSYLPLGYYCLLTILSTVFT